MAEGLAQKIANGDVPETIEGKQVVTLDMGLLVAGTKYRGEFEERLKKLMEEIKQVGGCVRVCVQGGGGVGGQRGRRQAAAAAAAGCAPLSANELGSPSPPTLLPTHTCSPTAAPCFPHHPPPPLPQQNDDIILMIDEVHTLIGAGAAEGAIDAANILKPALARGELQCIGATTIDEYRKHIEKDPVSSTLGGTVAVPALQQCSAVQCSEGVLAG